MVARSQTPPPADSPSFDIEEMTIPTILEPVAHAIGESRALLDRDDDWDGEGTTGFSEQIWRRAAEFVVHGTVQLLERHEIATNDIEILPTANGAIGVDWRTETRELLVTIPAAPNNDALFFGDDGSGNRTIKGSLDISAPNRWLTQWLAE